MFTMFSNAVVLIPGAPGGRLSRLGSFRRRGRLDMRHMGVLVAIIMALVTTMHAGAAEKISDADRFRLWNDCKPVRMFIQVGVKAGADIELTEDAVALAVRSRLRAARLYRKGTGAPILAVNVNAALQGFGVPVEFNKIVHDAVSNEDGFGVVWKSGSSGSHAGNGSYIMSKVSEHMDHFIDEYLRVNEVSCRKSE